MKLINRLKLRMPGRLGQTFKALTLGLVLAGATQASASILASDNFNSYTAASSLASQGGGSNGWATGWGTVSGTLIPTVTSDATITNVITGQPMLDYLPPGGTLIPSGANLIAFEPTAGSATPVISRQLYQPQSGTFYAAYAFQYGPGNLNTGDVVGMCLHETSANMANGVNVGLRGRVTGGAYYFARQGTANTDGPPPNPPVGTNASGSGPGSGLNSGTYIVVKLEKKFTGNYDTASVWVNPEVGSETNFPNGHFQVSTNTWGTDGFNINSVSFVSIFGQLVDNTDVVRVDSFAMATTFADLMGPAGPGPENAPPPDTIRVETLANGSGVVVPAQNVAAGSSITNYCIERNSVGGFVQNRQATSWQLINLTGGVVPGDLQISPDGRNAVFTGNVVGTAEILATVIGATNFPVASGTITVVQGPATQVRVETAADGSGTVVGAQTLTAPTPVTVYAISRDAGGNFLANVAATWSLQNITGGVVSGDLVPAFDTLSATFTAGVLPGTVNIRATSGILTSVDSGLIRVTRALTWSGTSATWDAPSVNWFLADLTTLSNSIAGDDLNFDDTGLANPVVNLVGSLNPRSVAVGGTIPYTFSGAGTISGATTLTVASGAGTLTVLNDNNYTGQTTISSPVVIGNGGATGSLGAGGDIRFNAATSITYNRTNSLTMNNRIYNSTGQIIVESGTLTLAGTVANAVQPLVKTNATLVLAKTAANAAAATGNWTIDLGGTVLLGGIPGDQINSVGSAVTTINGTLDLRGQNEGILTTGTGVIDSSIFPYGPCTLTLGNSAFDSDFTGVIQDSGAFGTNVLSMTASGSRTLTLGGASPNTYRGTTTVNGGVLKIASANAIPHGIGFGSLVVLNASTNDLNGNNITINGLNGGTGVGAVALVLDYAATTTVFTVGDGDANGSFGGRITGTFGVTKIGTGTQTFRGNMDYSGATVISNGTLHINGILTNSPVTVSAGATLGGAGSISNSVSVSGTVSPGTNVNVLGKLTVGGASFAVGSQLFMELNRTNVATNDVLAGPVTAGGTLTVANIGPALLVGNRFHLFSAAPAGSFGSTVLPAGYTWSNNIAGAGWIQVLAVTPTVPTTPTNLTFVASPGSISLSWPLSYLGWSLQTQTNALNTGLGTNWVTIPGTALVTSTNFPVVPGNPTVFYRMFYLVP